MVGSDMLVAGLKKLLLSIAQKVAVQAAGSTGSALRYAVMFLNSYTIEASLLAGPRCLSPAELAERGKLCWSTLKNAKTAAM